MLFFSSASDQYYGYDALSNKIVSIPTKWVEKIHLGQSDTIIEHLDATGVIKNESLLIEGLEQDWHQKSDKLGTLTLNVTDACNLRCTYCAYSDHYPFERSHGKSVMSFDVAKKSIDYYLANTQNVILRRISIYGGEPSLAKELVKK